MSSLGFCSVSSDNFFVFRYAYLSLVLAIDFWNSQLIVFLYISYLKKSQRGGPTFKLWRGSGVLLLNFEGGPEVPPLSFRGSRVPLLNFEGGPGSRSPGPIFSPCQCNGHVYVLLWNSLQTEAAIQRCSYKKVFWKYAANSCWSPILLKIAKQLYWNHPSASVFSCKFAACFQNTFS